MTIQRLEALFSQIGDRRWGFTATVVYGGSGQDDRIAINTIRIPDAPQFASQLQQDLANDGMLRISKTELETVLSAQGMALETTPKKLSGFQYAYWFVSQPDGVEVEALRAIDTSWNQERRHRQSINRAQSAALFDSLLVDGNNLGLSDTFLRNTAKGAA